MGLSESIHAKMPHCWNSHVVAQLKWKRCLLSCFIVIRKLSHTKLLFSE